MNLEAAVFHGRVECRTASVVQIHSELFLHTDKDYSSICGIDLLRERGKKCNHVGLGRVRKI